MGSFPAGVVSESAFSSTAFKIPVSLGSFALAAPYIAATRLLAAGAACVADSVPPPLVETSPPPVFCRETWSAANRPCVSTIRTPAPLACVSSDSGQTPDHPALRCAILSARLSWPRHTPPRGVRPAESVCAAGNPSPDIPCPPPA